MARSGVPLLRLQCNLETPELPQTTYARRSRLASATPGLTRWMKPTQTVYCPK